MLCEKYSTSWPQNRNAMAEYRLIKNFAGVETCLECGAIFYGRSNRKFCCDACKNKYHNRHFQDIRNRKLRVKSVLAVSYTHLTLPTISPCWKITIRFFQGCFMRTGFPWTLRNCPCSGTILSSSQLSTRRPAGRSARVMI